MKTQSARKTHRSEGREYRIEKQKEWHHGVSLELEWVSKRGTENLQEKRTHEGKAVYYEGKRGTCNRESLLAGKKTWGLSHKTLSATEKKQTDLVF